MARTDTLGNFLTDVADAIRTKKGTTDTIQASNFDTEIASIDGGGSSKYAPRYISFYFYEGTDLENELSNLDLKNMTITKRMFERCSNLISLDVSTFDTSNITDMNSMFGYCSKLTSLDLSSFNTSNVTNMNNMFVGCNQLTSINLSNFNTSNVTSMNAMFSNCSKLTSLDLSSFNTSNVTNMGSMFIACKLLMNLDIRNFDFTKVTSYSSMFSSVPTDCLIIVKDDTAKAWVLDKRSDLTNVKTVAELGA